MTDTFQSKQGGWRIPKACQECRKRKIRCNGLNPCKTCELRNTDCVYRDFIRHRRKQHEYQVPQGSRPRHTSPGIMNSGEQNSVMENFPNSVSATHMASPSCQMQLYYGPTSHFSLMQHVYRDLFSHPTAQSEPAGEVDEAGAGLDLFSFRRIFFGTPDTHEGGKGGGPGDVPVMFLPQELARLFLSRFLSTLYHMMPHRPKSYLEQLLIQLYSSSPSTHPDTLAQAILLLALATASLGTEYFAWGDVLYERVKASLAAFDDVVNLQTIQISLLMISPNEQGRPNSAFLHLGSASRKALSAGLHKDVPHNDVQTQESIEERRITFWSLYLYETWFCFHSGRPSSLSLKDVAIEPAQDPFVARLVGLCKTISRSTDEIYSQRHESLLHMWRVARSIREDLHGHEAHLEQELGFGLDATIRSGSLGVQQTIFTTLYYHTLLLTFRPFLIFRGHWQRDMKMHIQEYNDRSAKRPTETPPWLHEACNYALTAAQKTIHHLCEASRVNDLVRQLRYHGYFMGSSTFTLIYDFLHDPKVAPVHLPWVYASLQNLSTMRAGEPIKSTISAIQTVLRKINPAYEWTMYPNERSRDAQPEQTSPSQQTGVNDNHPARFAPALLPNQPQGPKFDSPTSQWNLPALEMPETVGSGGSGEDLLDFTQSDMGWDFDFSTMDLEAFLSIHQSPDLPIS